MTVREIEVATIVASRSVAKSYSRSTHQSASRRASHADTSPSANCAGSSAPACGMLSSNGASWRSMRSQFECSFRSELHQGGSCGLLLCARVLEGGLVTASLWFGSALLDAGWTDGVRFSIAAGRIAAIESGVAPTGEDERHAT